MASSLTQSDSNEVLANRSARWAGFKKPFIEISGVAALYLALTIILTWPLILHLGNTVPGDTNVQDQLQNLWNFWWAKFSLVHLHTNPFHSDYLLYPYGADLYLHTLDLTNGLLSLPFQFISLIFAYNAVLLISNTLTGVATYFFARELGLARPGAWVAGFLMAFSPVHLHFLNGEVEFANFGWFILYLLLLLKFEKSSRRLNWGYILAGGILIAVIGYTSAYELVWLAGVNFLWFLKELWLERGRIKNWLVNWLGGGVVGALVLSPFLVGGIIEFAAGNTHTQEDLNYLNSAGVSLTGFLVPHYYNPLVTNNSLFNLLTNSSSGYNSVFDDYFIGIGFLALAIFGTYLYFRYRELKLGFWLLVALVFWILSLGPELSVFRNEGTGVPLPYRLFLELPFSRIVRNSARFAEVFLFGVALAGGYAFQKIISKKYSFKFKNMNRVLAGVILVILLFEFWKLPYPTQQFEIPASYTHIQGDGAILELPLNKRDTADAFSMYYQTYHNRPILPAYLSRRIASPYELDNSPLTLAVYRANRPDIYGVPAAENALNMLRQQGVGTIIFHRDQEESVGKMTDYLAQIAGQPYYQDSTTSLYRVEPGPTRPVFVIGDGWYDPETDAAGQTARWAKQTADFDIYMPQSGPVTLSFQAVAYAQAHHLKLIVNGQDTNSLTIATSLQPFQLKLNLVKGRNNIVLSGQEPALSPNQTGQGGDTRKLFIQVRQLSITGN